MKEKSRESNFIRHWVRIKLEGFKPERIISEAIARGMTIRQIDYKDETEVCMTVAEEDFRIIKKFAKSKYKFTIIGVGGAHPVARKIKAGKMMIAGMAIFLLFFGAQTLFVREINVIGCKSITESSIRECLREEGLYEGSRKNFDCDAIEHRLFKEFDNIVWAKVAYEGNYVEVKISESKQVPSDKVGKETPCNIVADQDCYIERILSYTGRSVVAKNDFVKKGDILITGTIPIEHPSYEMGKDDSPEHYVHAAGKIVARVPYYYSFYMEPTDDVKAAAGTMLREWIAENIPESAQILNKDFHFDKKKNIIRVYGTVETRQQVGKEKEIVIDKHKRGTKEDTDRG